MDAPSTRTGEAAVDTYDSGPIRDHEVVSHEEWLQARVALLEREKAFSRARDELARARRALPWERVDKTYAFETPNGTETLADLFEGRRQLLVYHFMFAPGAKQGCPGCSFFADSFDVLAIHPEHLHQRDTTFVAVSRGPLAQLDEYKRRMGWRFKWVSSGDGDFNYDYFVSFRPEERQARSGFYNYQRGEAGQDREGASAFYKDENGTVFHTYSTYARGIDLLNMTYNALDLTAKGRDEEHLDEPMAWVRHHDRYPAVSASLGV
jgi:predicted dithiol-disulfide oxidoreductase (DUF899 family)